LHKYKNEIASADSIESLNKFLDETFSKFNDVIFLKYILLIKNFEFDDEFLNLNRRNFMEIKKKMWEKDNIKKIENIKEKLLNREDLCNVNWPICIYDPSLKYQYNDSLIYRQLNDNNNIIEDYFINDKNLRGKKYFSLKDNMNNRNNLNIDYETVLIERKPHFCKNYNKNVSNDLENESNSSKISSEDEFKIEVEDYLEKKKKYKNIRKMSNIGVCSYLYYKNLNSKNKNRINDKDENNLEKFISKGLINYSKYSLQNLSLQQLPNNFLSKVNS
jgi:hypothetical protein